MKEVIELTINRYISEKEEELYALIEEHNKVFIESNPATGKTTFFKETAKRIIDNSLKRRIVFVFPLLLIQDQLKESLIKDGYQIDLELNFRANRKYLKESDRIITSTFQSLNHISETLTEDDIIIVDEAHSLLKSYLDTFSSERTFYAGSIKDLYFTQAKLVLMSGTPPPGIIKILGLRHLKLVNNPPPLKAKIKLLSTKRSKIELAVEFAKTAIYRNGPNSLNIIYIKDIRKSVQIAYILKDLNITAKVLNSEEKKGSLYLSIAKRLIVPEDIQILITTNIISSGANIMNENIGEALMIDEYTPAEIKQFSKRFRNKLDMDVTVSNTPLNGQSPLLSTMIDRKIIKQRNYLNRVLTSINILKDKIRYDYDYSFSYDKTPLGTPDDLISTILERYLKQETYYWENYYKLVEDSNKYLEEELNKYDDIEATFLKYPSIVSEIYDDKDEQISSEIKNIMLDFIKHPKKYISTLINYEDSFARFRLLRLLGPFNNGKTSAEALENIKHPLFQKEILDPLLDNLEYFENDPRRCLYFFMTNTRQELTKYKIAHSTSQFLNSFVIFDPRLDSPGDYKAVLSSIPAVQSLDKEAKNLYTIIDIISQNYFSANAVILSNLLDELNQNPKIKNVLKLSNNYQRLPLIELNKNKGEYILTRPFLNALIRGIFFLNNNPTKIVNSKNKKVKGYLFNVHFPQKDNRINYKEYDRMYEKAKKKSIPIVSSTVINKPTEKYALSFREEEITKIPSSPELLQLQYFKKDYYDLFED